MSGRRLPPLNALRAFEAAARHLSFTRAAEELNVTQAAVSHQVKALEERLGLRMFERHGRGLWLTEEGEIYLPFLRQAFDLIADGTDLIEIAGGYVFADLTITTVGSTAEIDVDGHTITVFGASAGDFSSADFIFS